MSDKRAKRKIVPDFFDGQWSVEFIADYWRLRRNRCMVATFNTKGAAMAGLAVEKRRAEGK